MILWEHGAKGKIVSLGDFLVLGKVAQMQSGVPFGKFETAYMVRKFHFSEIFLVLGRV